MVRMMSERGGDGLKEKLKVMQRENQRRGAVALGLVLLVVLWAFSVPPEIRRSVICTSQAELEAGLNGCVDASAVWQKVVDHYETCGPFRTGTPCVMWDFSIDPAKRSAVPAVIDAVLGADAAEAASQLLRE